MQPLGRNAQTQGLLLLLLLLPHPMRPFRPNGLDLVVVVLLLQQPQQAAPSPPLQLPPLPPLRARHKPKRSRWLWRWWCKASRGRALLQHQQLHQDLQPQQHRERRQGRPSPGRALVWLPFKPLPSQGQLSLLLRLLMGC